MPTSTGELIAERLSNYGTCMYRIPIALKGCSARSTPLHTTPTGCRLIIPAIDRHKHHRNLTFGLRCWARNVGNSLTRSSSTLHAPIEFRFQSRTRTGVVVHLSVLDVLPPQETVPHPPRYPTGLIISAAPTIWKCRPSLSPPNNEP
ncbi:hypothetical protein JAAARDRAFT_40397 [Jaapia argillacea MUCL 33604]|uniref:Uncharacterized protein n=1 Tax=Jaapia argillacea MUCL 33604 TaxID=933084 RepID=A0A067PBH8_9AGAM|nr:hypothetical protein JAAARDRAFT_40397 [Jaapia argillacea MUCL 33604]